MSAEAIPIKVCSEVLDDKSESHMEGQEPEVEKKET